MKSAEEWSQEINAKGSNGSIETQLSFIKQIQSDALRESIRIADTFALNHKLSAPEVIIAIQIRDAIERLVKEIET